MATEVDEEALVGHLVSTLTLVTQSVLSAVGDPVLGFALIDRALAAVRDKAAAEGLLPEKQTKCRVDDLKPEDTGIVAIRHNLGAERVVVRLFSADGRPRKHRRMGVPISDDEVEVIAESTDVAYAEVEVLGE